MEDHLSPPDGTNRRPFSELIADQPQGDITCNTDAWRAEETSREVRSKAATILKVCSSGHGLSALIALATTKHGLVDDEVRRKAWPIILGYSGEDTENTPGSWRDLPRHRDEDQVALDVNRSFIYYPKDESNMQLDRRKVQLSDVIVQVLRQHPMLSYFQGFHDIVQVFLLVLGPDDAARAVAHVSLLRIRDFMLPSLTPSLAHLQLLPSILYAVDPKLCKHLSTTRPYFALAATLTLYAHDIQEYADISRLFDFLLAQPAVVSVYFFAVIILSRRSELFEIPADEPDMLHFVLSKLPQPLDLESLISEAMTVYRKHPPEKLPWRAWSKISCYSVLKTTRESPDKQSIASGEALLEDQAAQLKREQLRKKFIAQAWIYRRPIGGIGLAVLVGVLSFWLRRIGVEGMSGFCMTKTWDIVKHFRI